MKQAARRDANEDSIVDALRARGACVAKLSGDGLPDLLVSYRGVLSLLEVKDTKEGRARPLKGKHDDPNPAYRDLTPAQVKWWRRWEGKPPVIVHDADDAIAAIIR